MSTNKTKTKNETKNESTGCQLLCTSNMQRKTLLTQAVKVLDDGTPAAVVDGLALVEQNHLVELREYVRSRLVDGANHDHALLGQLV